MVEARFVSVPADTGPLDLSRPLLVGIVGAGMDPLAFLLASRGATVTGSDLRSTETTETTDCLKAVGVTMHRETGHLRPLRSLFQQSRRQVLLRSRSRGSQ